MTTCRIELDPGALAHLETTEPAVGIRTYELPLAGRKMWVALEWCADDLSDGLPFADLPEEASMPSPAEVTHAIHALFMRTVAASSKI